MIELKNVSKTYKSKKKKTNCVNAQCCFLVNPQKKNIF